MRRNRRLLVALANHGCELWNLDPEELGRKRSPLYAEALTAILWTFYVHARSADERLTDSICRTLGWPEMKPSYHRFAVERRHVGSPQEPGYLEDANYRYLYERLCWFAMNWIYEKDSTPYSEAA